MLLVLDDISASQEGPRGELHSVLTLRRGLAILDAFSVPREDLGVNEIARLVNLHKSTVSRLCGTLEQAGYLKRDDVTGKFRLGGRVFQLVGTAAPDVDLRAIARPVLRELVETCGDTAHLAIHDGQDVVTVEVVDGYRLMRMQGRIGQRQLVHASALGKAILAWRPNDVDRILAVREMIRLTPNTITDPEQFKQQLSEVRERGYSLDLEELEEGLRCVGAPIRDHGGEVIAAISVAGPRHRFTTSAIGTLSRMVRNSADEISARLGSPPRLLRTEAAGSLKAAPEAGPIPIARGGRRVAAGLPVG